MEYVPTKQNPADIASRGTTATQLVENKLWWNGPEFLTKSNEHWPTQPSNNQEDDSELKPAPRSVITATVDVAQVPSITKLIDSSKYSNITRLLRVTVYVIRFINNLKKRRQNLEVIVDPITNVQASKLSKGKRVLKPVRR